MPHNWIKPGGTNLTYGFSTREELDDQIQPVVPPMVFRAFESENLESLEPVQIRFFNGKARANIAVFSYDYENLHKH